MRAGQPMSQSPSEPGRAKLNVLISRERLAARAAEMGAQIGADLRREEAQLREAGQVPGPCVLVPVLTGALVFAADLIRAIPMSLSIRPVTLSSYPGTATTSQGVAVPQNLPADLKGKRVIIVDDILDSGQTLGLLRRVFAAQQPQSLRIGVLLNKHKPGGRTEEVAVEYAGFDIEDRFVVGYGLDYDGLYRNLPDVCELVLP
jgi:hypoxanthine phosphoribosyltransferase